MLISNFNARIQTLEDELFTKKQVSLSVLRLDEIHPVVSGNKLFKLHYFLQAALQHHAKGIISFGGAFSNHLVATAYACRNAGLGSVGIVRGEQPALLSHTLKECLSYGMELQFFSRNQYDKLNDPVALRDLCDAYSGYITVPEGGYDPLGASGASYILNAIEPSFSHICCAVGTATTISGLLLKTIPQQLVIGIPVLKGMTDIHERVAYLTGGNYNKDQLVIMNDYHFGGYAKKTAALIEFMNALYHIHDLPTDFVYTGKMMFGVMDAIKKDRFRAGSHILCLHTGGLQGNLTVQAGALVF